MQKSQGLATAAALLAGLFAFVTAPPLSAQAAPPSGGCAVRTTPESPGDRLMDRGSYDKAAGAYRSEMATAGDPDRVHDALVRAMLASGQIAEAESDATAWAAKAPNNAWAVDALAEAQWRKGDINAALASIQKAVNLDNCNPRARADVAQFDRFSSRYLDAKLQINMAHHTDPIDRDILDEWLATLPRETQLDWATNALKQTDLSPDDRRSLEKWKDQLSEPPGFPCRLVSKLDSATIPYRRIQDGPNAPVFWGLDVGFNGKGRRMQIDTGASGLNLYKSAATALHLDIEKAPYKTMGIGNGGDVDTYIAKVSSIKIGALEFADCVVHILDVRPNSENPDSADDGLIGGDVFSSFLITLDFPGHTMKLDPLPPVPGAETETQSLQTGVEDRHSAAQNRYIAPSMANWTKVFRSSHNLVIPVRLDKGPVKLFIVDTGSALNLISPQAASEVVKVMKGADVDLFGISGKVAKAYTTMPLTLVFGGMSQPTSGLTALDMTQISNGAEIELSGFLGQPTLHQMTVQIDYRDALMNFSFDPKRLVRLPWALSIAAGAGDLFLGHARYRVGFVILFAIVTGFVPQLFAMLELGFGLGDIDLVGMQRCLREDGDALRQHFHESPRHEKDLIAGASAVQPHLARSQFGQQRGVAVERLHIAAHRRQLDSLRRRVQQDAVRRDETDSEEAGLCGVCHFGSQALGIRC